MPIPKTPSLINRDMLVTHLCDIELGTSTLGQASVTLGIDEAALIAAVENDPTLVEEVAAAVAAVKVDPETAVRRSIEGLNSVADALAKRVAADAATMSTAELSQAGTLLDRISAVSAQRAAETKSKAKGEDDDAGDTPVGGIDFRPSPDGKPSLWMFYLPPDHAAAKDARANRRKNQQGVEEDASRAQQLAWLDKWFPRDDKGQIHDLAYLIGQGGWWMTPDGKRHKGVAA